VLTACQQTVNHKGWGFGLFPGLFMPNLAKYTDQQKSLYPDIFLKSSFITMFSQPVLHEGRLHAVEGYPS
jgi:hypothetical protein